jgi:Signal recognition particle 14kD protein
MQTEPEAVEVMKTEPLAEPAPPMRRARRPLGHCDSMLLTAYNQSGKTSVQLTDKKANASTGATSGDDNNDVNAPVNSEESENVVPLTTATDDTKTAAKSKSKRYINTVCCTHQMHSFTIHFTCIMYTYMLHNMH